MEGGWDQKDEREKRDGRERKISNIITYKYRYIQIVLQGSMAGIIITFAERIRGHGHLLRFCVRNLGIGIKCD